jgi:hypothetical protein
VYLLSDPYVLHAVSHYRSYLGDRHQQEVSYFPLNSVIAKETSDLINPFIADKDTCGDSKDDDGDGYVDDNCGTMSLNVKHNMSGAVSNITSICHEDCHIDGPEEDNLE